MILEDLKKKYDDKSINDIEQTCTKYSALSSKNRKDFILGLFYLERTKRFHENHVYAASSFETYIRNSYNLRYTTYNNERFVFIAHPDAAARWGVGLVSRIKHDCGAGKVPEVMNQIDALKNPNHTSIEKIILKNTKERTGKKSAPVDSKRDLEKDNIRKGKTIADYIQTINKQNHQIAALKDSVTGLKKEKVELAAKVSLLENTVSILREEKETLKKKLNPTTPSVFVMPTYDFFSEQAYYEQTA